jgi:NAD(P)H-hydrate epimerase
MRKADQQAGEIFGIEPAQLMEVAGFQVARLTRSWLSTPDQRVAIVCGAGNNGGDALVAARHLFQRGVRVTAWVMPPRSGSLAMRQLDIALRLGIPCSEVTNSELPAADLILDGLLGTGIRPPVREREAALIRAMNAAGPPLIAIDIPSGLDPDGEISGDSVRAVATITLGLAKPGLLDSTSVGRLFLADIGMPPAIFGRNAPAVAALYAKGDLLELV